jgi:uncharacterized protein with FMN-binding domain
MKDGTYEGRSFKFPGRFIVSMDVKEGRITDIRVTKHFALSKYNNMLKPMIERMIAEQKADVDVVTGATISCRALRKAAARAIEQALGSSQE